MMARIIIKIGLAALLFGAGWGAHLVFSRSPAPEGSAVLSENRALLRQIVLAGDAMVKDDWCFGNENRMPQGFSVGDFMLDYLEFLGSSGGMETRFSAFEACGTRSQGECGFSYGLHGRHDDKGYRRTLWFKLVPQTNRIDTSTFVCSMQ